MTLSTGPILDTTPWQIGRWSVLLLPSVPPVSQSTFPPGKKKEKIQKVPSLGDGGPSGTRTRERPVMSRML